MVVVTVVVMVVVMVVLWADKRVDAMVASSAVD